MRDVISDFTLQQINAVLDEILVNLNDNVRNIEVNSDLPNSSALPVLANATNYDDTVISIKGSAFRLITRLYPYDELEVNPIDNDAYTVVAVVGDKNGVCIYDIYEYHPRELYKYFFQGFIRGINGGGYKLHIARFPNTGEGSGYNTICPFELSGLTVGNLYTVSFTGKWNYPEYSTGTSKFCISTTASDVSAQNYVVISDDLHPHEYTLTFTASAETMYLNFDFGSVDWDYVIHDDDYDNDDYVVTDLILSGMEISVVDAWISSNGTKIQIPLGGGGGGTSDLDAIEMTYAEYQQLSSAEKLDPDKIYFITDYPDGGSVIEGYLHNGAFYEDAQHTVEIVPDNARIYINLTDDTQYRWSGTVYVQLSKGVALGETSTTAYRGDRGKTAYDHATESGKISAAVSSGLYKIAATAQGHIASATAVVKADITTLGIPAQDTTYSVVSKTENGLCPQLPNETTTTKFLRQDGTWVVPSYPTVNNATLTIQKNGTTVKTFTANASSNVTANITVPTKVSELTDDVVSGHYLPLTGGTLTGRLTMGGKPVSQIITGTGTVGQDKGSGQTNRYVPSEWKFNTGVTVADGDIFTIKIPVAGISYGVWVSMDNGTTYYPVAINGTTRLGTHYGSGSFLTLQYENSGSVSVYARGGSDSSSTVTKIFRVVNFYNSDTNTQVRVYRQTTGYNNDYPLLASRTLASSIGTAGTNSSYTAIYGVMWDDTTKIPTLNPSTGEIKAVKFTGAFNGTATSATSATTASKLSNTSKVGDTNKPVYFTANGVPATISYEINKAVPSDAVFTDTKVTQTASTTNSSYEVLFSYTADNTTRTEGARKCNKIKANPSTGLLYSKGIGIDNGQITTVYGVSTITYNGNTISLPSSDGTLALTSDIKIHEIREYTGTITGDVVRVTHNLGLGTSYKPIVSWNSSTAIVMYGMKNITTNYFEIMFASINGYVIGTATGISVTIRWTY